MLSLKRTHIFKLAFFYKGAFKPIDQYSSERIQRSNSEHTAVQILRMSSGAFLNKFWMNMVNGVNSVSLNIAIGCDQLLDVCGSRHKPIKCMGCFPNVLLELK